MVYMYFLFCLYNVFNNLWKNRVNYSINEFKETNCQEFLNILNKTNNFCYES